MCCYRFALLNCHYAIKELKEYLPEESRLVMVKLSKSQFCLDYTIIVIGAVLENSSDVKSDTTCQSEPIN